MNEHRDAPTHDRYSIVRRLGEGGMGVVYEAVDRQSGSRIALKTIRTSDPAMVYRFKREFRALADVTHPNLVTLHDLVLHGQELFFTMELIEGVDFLQHVRFGAEAVFDDTFTGSMATSPLRRSSMTIEEVSSTKREAPRDLRRVVDAARQLAQGVGALHSARRLHRDIKPSNIRVAIDGRVVLLDFGLVAELMHDGARDTLEQQIIGTAEYMSPEQAAGLPLSEASDWYSVGVVLFEALTGQVPFRGPRIPVLLAKNNQDAPRPSDMATGVPADLEQLCVDLLRRDPALRPDHREILRRLGVSLGQLPAGGARHIDVAPIGRDDVIAALESALNPVVDGKPALVIVQGASGMGKTTLLKRVLSRWVTKRDAVLLAGRCFERDAMPFKAMDSVVDALTRYLLQISPAAAAARLPRDAWILGRMFPVLRRVPAVAAQRARGAEGTHPAELRRRAFAALRELLVRIADGNRLVIWIDDLQWGDRDSVALVAEILRSEEDASIAVVASFRVEDGGRAPAVVALRQLAARADDALCVTQIDVGPLNAADATALAASLLQREGHSGAEAPAIAREAAGVPFLVAELVRYRIDSEARRLRRSVPTSSHVRLEDVVLDRLDTLPPNARLLLELIAIAGHPLLREIATCAAPLSPEEDRRVVARLQAEHWIRTVPTAAGETLVMSHERIRECIASIVGDARAKQLHRCIGDAFELAEALDPESVAIHYRAAGDIADAARHASAAAALATSALAFDRAVEWHRLALEEPGLGDDVIAARRAALADALSRAGRGAEAGGEFLEAAEHAPSDDAIEWRRRGAEEMLFSGKIVEGLAALSRVLADVGMKVPASHRQALLVIFWTRMLLFFRGFSVRVRPTSEISPHELRRIDVCWSASLGLTLVDPVIAFALSGRGLLLALNAGDANRASRALTHEVGNAAMTSPRAAAKVELAAEKLAGVAGPYARAFFTSVHGIHMDLMGRWVEALDALEHGARRFREECIGASYETRTTDIFTLWTLFHLGRMRDVIARAQLMIEEARERGDIYWHTMLRSGVLNLIWIADDNPERALAEADDAIKQWPTKVSHLQHYYDLLARCHIDLYCERPAEARARIDAMYGPLERAFVLRPRRIRVESLFLRARVLLALRDDALLPRVARDSRRVRRTGFAWAGAMAELLDAAIAARRGNVELACVLLDGAAHVFDQTQMTMFAALARRGRGTLLGGDEGSQLVVEADGLLRAQRIRRPDRWAALLVPSFDR